MPDKCDNCKGPIDTSGKHGVISWTVMDGEKKVKEEEKQLNCKECVEEEWGE